MQHVPLRDLKIVRLIGGQTQVASIPRFIESGLPWNDSVAGFAQGGAGSIFFRDNAGMVAATSWFDEGMADRLSRCYRQEADAAAKAATVLQFRHNCRILPTREDESDLGFHCRACAERFSSRVSGCL